jgi:hypothetical protein
MVISKLSFLESHESIASVFYFGQSRSELAFSRRLESFLMANPDFPKECTTYSSIITTSTTKLKGVKEFFKKHGFVKVCSAVGHHGTALHVMVLNPTRSDVSDEDEISYDTI